MWKHDYYASTSIHIYYVSTWKHNYYVFMCNHKIRMKADVLLQYHNSYAYNNIIIQTW